MAHVLVVDDASFMRTMLRSILEAEGHTVSEASNGLEAIEKVQASDFDLVTMDITMPEMGGIEALEKIIRLKPKQLVVMCTAMGQDSMVAQAIQAGARDFIVKPFQVDRIRDAINKLELTSV
jgi:two-component system, chemotaxis family, chemotaxis protein CheY